MNIQPLFVDSMLASACPSEIVQSNEKILKRQNGFGKVLVIVRNETTAVNKEKRRQEFLLKVQHCI